MAACAQFLTVLNRPRTKVLMMGHLHPCCSTELTPRETSVAEHLPRTNIALRVRRRSVACKRFNERKYREQNRLMDLGYKPYGSCTWKRGAKCEHSNRRLGRGFRPIVQLLTRPRLRAHAARVYDCAALPPRRRFRPAAVIPPH